MKKLILTVLLALFALTAAAAPATAAPELSLEVTNHPEGGVSQGASAAYEVEVSNTGDAPQNGVITLTFTAPAGTEVVAAESSLLLGVLPPWNCSVLDSQTARCTGPSGLPGLRPGPGEVACPSQGGCPVYFTLTPDESFLLGDSFTPTVTACSLAAPECGEASAPTVIRAPQSFAVKSFDGDVLRRNGDPQTQAGSRPHIAFTEFFLSSLVTSEGTEYPAEDLQDAVVRVPPGLAGNPAEMPTCTQAQLGSGSGGTLCPPESQVGFITVWRSGGGLTPGNYDQLPVGVYNMERPAGTEASPIGTPALFAFKIGGVKTQAYARLRTGEDYGVTVLTKNAPQTLAIAGVDFEFWGVPADPAHDPRRFCANFDVPGCASADSADPRAFLSLPTSCTGPVETFLDATSWQGGADDESFITAPGGTGCAAVPFAPEISARPTTNAGDAPSGLDVELRVPQSDDPDSNASAHLRDTTVTLPEGLVINPSGANGLGACTEAQFGYTSTDPDGTIHTTPGPATCPDASKVATVQVESPLLDHPLRGAAYIATPGANPFNSLLALYISIDDPQTGIVAKLAGEVSPDPATGRLTTTFTRSPQLPFETFRLNFFGGAGGPLRTPAICGTHTTDAELVPWSAPDAGPTTWLDAWQITHGCANTPAEMPHGPGFDAGVVAPIAGAHSPFVVHLRRDDGSQNFAAVTLTPPPGLTAKLAGTPACPEAALAAAAAKSGQAERADPSCPLASQVGTVNVAAGAGPAPYNAPAKAYLTGPYKSAPLSLAVIAPATAGPFDLGTVVVKTALHVNPVTAEITAVSDPIPSILQGIPLDVRTISIALDKPEFTLTGTSCNAMAVGGLLTSTLGAVAPLSARYQLGECTGLGFKPRMAIRLKGGTARGKHPQLSAFVLPRAGDANIRSVSVAFPRSEFLENAHIRTICTRPDFAADRCPAGAVYGTSTVYSPLLDYPLSGNVYLRSSDNLLPDIVPDLRGPAHQPIRVEAAGRTDSIRGGIRNTFDFFPDAPFSRAVLRMQGGNKGLLVNSRNICARTYRARVVFTAHNGARRVIRPKLKAQCKRKGKRRKGKRGGHGRGAKGSVVAARATAR